MNLKIDKKILNLIDTALVEDAAGNDVTSRTLCDPELRAQAFIIVKQPAVLCGNALVKKIFQRLDRTVSFRLLHSDGTWLRPYTQIAAVAGKARSLLAGERVALNFLGHLCGVATLTRDFVKRVKGTRVHICDTRKTIPGLRSLEKYAVRCGGGVNHRFDLSQMAFVKDNHRAALGNSFSFQRTVFKLRQTGKPVLVEVQTLAQLKSALRSRPDIILLDNMRLSQIKKAVALRNQVNRNILLEVSGGINLTNIRRIARSGVERISIGALTHSAKAADISLEFTEKRRIYGTKTS